MLRPAYIGVISTKRSLKRSAVTSHFDSSTTAWPHQSCDIGQTRTCVGTTSAKRADNRRKMDTATRISEVRTKIPARERNSNRIFPTAEVREAAPLALTPMVVVLHCHGPERALNTVGKYRFAPVGGRLMRA